MSRVRQTVQQQKGSQVSATFVPKSKGNTQKAKPKAK